MGIYINVKDGVRHYGSTHMTDISIMKDGLSSIDLGKVTYKVRGQIIVWDSKEAYDQKDNNRIYTNVMIEKTVDDVPANLYTVIYDKLKTGLSSYDDDI